MLKLARLIVLIATPIFFWGAWYYAPSLLEADGLRWLSGVVTILWALEFYFFRKLGDVSAVQGISTREHERLVLRLASIRKRVWWIGGIGLICALTMWVMSALKLPLSSPIYAGLVGVLFGISLSYLILIPGWFNESQEFIDEARRRDAQIKKQAEITKAIDSAKK